MADDKKILKMPVNYEAEQAMLGSIMMDSNVCNNYTPLLKEGDFALPQHKLIFTAAQMLVNSVQPVDALTVADKLTVTDKISAAGGMEYINKLVTSIPSTANADKYFDIVKRCSLLREIIEAGNKISRNAYSDEDSLHALDLAESTVFEISQKRDESKLVQIKDATAAAYTRITDIQEGRFVDDGIKTGFERLDNIVESVKPGALCILAARPSVGKTAFALTVAINAAVLHDKKVAVFSYEMPTIQLVQRMMTTVSQVSLKRQNKMGMLSYAETTKLYQAHEALTHSKIYIDDNAGNTPAEIISKCRRMKNTDGLDLVIIDYLQLISLGERKENRQQEVSEMSRKMKLFSKELNVPFIVLSQLSRNTEQRGDEPMLSDLRESGSIEQDADIVMFIHQPKKVENPKSEESLFAANFNEQNGHKFLKMIVAKNRNGDRGVCYFDFDGDKQLFKAIEINKLSTEEQPAIKVNTEITKLSDIDKGDENDAFAGLAVEERHGVVEEIADDEIAETDGVAENSEEDTNLPF